MATFRQRGKRWQAIIRRSDLRATKTFETKGDAQVWARGLERKADLGEVMPGKLEGTLGPVIDRYERKVWPVKRWGRSKENELSALKTDLGGRLLKSINRTVLLQYIQGLDLSPGGRTTRLSYLREVFKTAGSLWDVPVPLGELDLAIAKARELKLIGKAGVRTRRPTQEEIAKLLAYEPKGEMMVDLRGVVEVLAVLPLRLGELLGIQWTDLIADRRMAVIRSRKHPDIRVKEKNDQEVPLITFGGVDTYALIAGRPQYLPSPFPYKQNSVSQAFGIATDRLGIKDLHLHDFRAYSLSRLLEAGVPIPQVAVISGHKNWKVLSRHYARIDPASVHDAVNRAEIAAAQGTSSPTPRRKAGVAQPSRRRASRAASGSSGS